jgi:hypothetical protein
VANLPNISRASTAVFWEAYQLTAKVRAAMAPAMYPQVVGLLSVFFGSRTRRTNSQGRLKSTSNVLTRNPNGNRLVKDDGSIVSHKINLSSGYNTK